MTRGCAAPSHDAAQLGMSWAESSSGSGNRQAAPELAFNLTHAPRERISAFAVRAVIANGEDEHEQGLRVMSRARASRALLKTMLSGTCCQSSESFMILGGIELIEAVVAVGRAARRKSRAHS